MPMTVPRWKRIGLDRMTFSSFKIKKMDIDYLDSFPAKTVSIETTKKYRCKRYLANQVGIRKIKIRDNHVFEELVIGYSHYADNQEYVYLTICLSNLYGNNLCPVTHVDYDECIDYVLDYILDTYHILLDRSAIEVHWMEINVTFPVKEEFKKYDRILRLFHPIRQSKKYEVSIEEKPGYTYSFKNQRFENIFYNKAGQLRAEGKEYMIPTGYPNIMRIELRLKKTDKINDVFHTRLWAMITDQMISDYFYHWVDENFLKKAEKWLPENRAAGNGKKSKNKSEEEKREEDLTALMFTMMEKFKKSWRDKLFRELQNRERENPHDVLLLDINQLYDIIRKSKLKNKKRLIEETSKMEYQIEHRDVFFNRDFDRIRELRQAIDEAYQNSLLSNCAPENGNNP